MKRGEVWTVSGGASHTGKPRPAVIVQEDRFDQTSSIMLCAFTTDPTDAPLLRMLIESTDRNGLKSASRLMIDKITTVPKARLGKRIGRLNDEDTVRLNRALTVFLGLPDDERPPAAGQEQTVGVSCLRASDELNYEEIHISYWFYWLPGTDSNRRPTD